MLFFVTGATMKDVIRLLVEDEVKAKLNETVPLPGTGFQKKGILIEAYLEEDDRESFMQSFEEISGAVIEFIGEVGEELRR